MAAAASPATPGNLSISERTCGYCGARLRVLTAHRQNAERAQEYACPECGKGYRIDASTEPEVQLLRPRSDGKDDRYQETMF